MKQELEGKLYIGKAVKVERYAIRKDYSYEYRGTRKGIVVALYPHIFTVRFGGYLESFRYSQCFEKNNERVRL